MSHVYTPRKEHPPSLSFGSSSSPMFESPPTVGKELRFMHWSPTQGRAKKSAAPQLLPSHFPPPQFGALPSSPPEVRSRLASVDRGSPRPRRAAAEARTSPAVKRRTPRGGRSAGRPAKRVAAPPLARPYPLLSSQAFAHACTTRVRPHTPPAPQAVDVLEPALEPVQEQFPSRGLGLSFIIDLNGKANVNPLILRPPTPKARGTSELDAASCPMTPHTRQTVNAILDEETDGESDGECDAHASKAEAATRTPPRFSSLGNSDAAAAFARTLARSREVGSASMFLFPSVASPQKQADLAPYTPFMPETPRRTAGSDPSSVFEYGLQTPQNSMYGFEAGAYYTTGMTPYLSVARAHEVANI